MTTKFEVQEFIQQIESEQDRLDEKLKCLKLKLEMLKDRERRKVVVQTLKDWLVGAYGSPLQYAPDNRDVINGILKEVFVADRFLCLECGPGTVAQAFHNAEVVVDQFDEYEIKSFDSSEQWCAENENHQVIYVGDFDPVTIEELIGGEQDDSSERPS